MQEMDLLSCTLKVSFNISKHKQTCLLSQSTCSRDTMALLAWNETGTGQRAVWPSAPPEVWTHGRGSWRGASSSILCSSCDFRHLLLQKINTRTPTRGVTVGLPNCARVWDQKLGDLHAPPWREGQCLDHVTHGGGRREGCSVNVCRINGQHTLTRVDSPPYLPMRVTPHWDYNTQTGILLEQAGMTWLRRC